MAGETGRGLYICDKGDYMKLRKAVMDDAELILKWRNDEKTRENSFSSDVIALEDHIKWLSRKLEDPKCHMFMLEDDGESVGNIRLDVLDKDDVGEISYMIAPDKRGKGYGKKILALVEEEARSKGIKVLTGLVKDENVASRKCFENAGYACASGGTIAAYIKTM